MNIFNIYNHHKPLFVIFYFTIFWLLLIVIRYYPIISIDFSAYMLFIPTLGLLHIVTEDFGTYEYSYNTRDKEKYKNKQNDN